MLTSLSKVQLQKKLDNAQLFEDRTYKKRISVLAQAKKTCIDGKGMATIPHKPFSGEKPSKDIYTTQGGLTKKEAQDQKKVRTNRNLTDSHTYRDCII